MTMENEAFDDPLLFLRKLEATICARRNDPPEESYTARLFAKGIPRMAQKVGEEGVEVALAAATGSPKLNEEAADLLYHTMVLLEACGSNLNKVIAVLETRARVGQRKRGKLQTTSQPNVT